MIQFFYYPQDRDIGESYLEFINTFKVKWNDIRSKIDELLKIANLGRFDASIGVVNKPFDVPDLVPIESFFGSYKKRCMKKLGILRKLSVFPNFFVKMYSASVVILIMNLRG